MVTARAIVTDALDLIGVHAAEEPLTAHQEQQGLRVLNDLIQNASLEQFVIYYMPPQVIPWPAGRAMLTWGLGGDIATPRPVQIGQQATYLNPLTQLQLPLTVLLLNEYRTLPRTPLVSVPLMAVSYAPSLPLGELYAYLPPPEPALVTVYPWQVLQTWENFDTDILMPPGYDRYLKAAAACDLAPYYDKEASAIVQGIRAEAKNNIKTVNVTIPLLDVPWFADPYHRVGINDY
jgi:hypothetical protein